MFVPIGDIEKAKLEIAKSKGVRLQKNAPAFVLWKKMGRIFIELLPVEKNIYDENQNLISEHNGVYFYILVKDKVLELGASKVHEQPCIAAKDNQKKFF